MWAVIRVLLVVSVASCVLGACTTTRKYRMVDEPLTPAPELHVVAASPALELELAAVIVYQGPGSWKQNALWDEYRISLHNRSSRPIKVDGLTLVDILGEDKLPGTDPWELERLSEANWERYARIGRFVLGVGAAVGAMEVAAIGYGLAGGGAAGILFVMPALLLTNVTAVAVMNYQNKDKVQIEFERRRLRLPVQLAPDATLQGSLFFPMVPKPQRLILRGTAADMPFELVMDLQRLAGLHVDPGSR